MKMNFDKQTGLTLIELLVAVAIVGILAAIAIPSYDYYTRNTKRTAVKTTMEQVRSLEEQYYANNKTYTGDLTQFGYTNSPLSVDKTGKEITVAGSGDITYQVNVNTLADGNLKFCASCQYEIIAVPQNTQTKDTNCAVMWYNSLGQKGSEDGSGTTTTTCW